MELKHKAAYDLTGLFNRCEGMWIGLQSDNNTISGGGGIMINVDYFKVINEVFTPYSNNIKLLHKIKLHIDPLGRRTLLKKRCTYAQQGNQVNSMPFECVFAHRCYR